MAIGIRARWRYSKDAVAVRNLDGAAGFVYTENSSNTFIYCGHILHEHDSTTMARCFFTTIWFQREALPFCNSMDSGRNPSSYMSLKPEIREVIMLVV